MVAQSKESLKGCKKWSIRMHDPEAHIANGWTPPRTIKAHQTQFLQSEEQREEQMKKASTTSFSSTPITFALSEAVGSVSLPMHKQTIFTNTTFGPQFDGRALNGFDGKARFVSSCDSRTKLKHQFVPTNTRLLKMTWEATSSSTIQRHHDHGKNYRPSYGSNTTNNVPLDWSRDSIRGTNGVRVSLNLFSLHVVHNCSTLTARRSHTRVSLL